MNKTTVNNLQETCFDLASNGLAIDGEAINLEHKKEEDQISSFRTTISDMAILPRSRWNEIETEIADKIHSADLLKIIARHFNNEKDMAHALREFVTDIYWDVEE